MKRTLFLCLLLSVSLLSACGQKAATPDITPSDNAQEAIAEPSQTTDASLSGKEDAAEAATETTTENDTQSSPSKEGDASLSNESIGSVSFSPNEKGYSMVYGDSTLHAYFKRQDVLPGAGKMTIKKLSDNSVVEEINLLDKNSCNIGDQDSMFSLLGWDGGTHIVISLKETPVSGEAYYVNLEQGAFTSQDGSILSKEITDNSTWCYAVAPYGIIPALPSGSSVYVGDVLSAKVLVKQPAAYAKIGNYDENRVRFNEKEFEADGKLEIRIYQIGDDPFTVTFYDDDDNPLGSITLTYTASMPPEPEQELPQKTITNL